MEIVAFCLTVCDMETFASQERVYTHRKSVRSHVYSPEN